MTTSTATDQAKAPRHAPHPSAGRGDREALLNLYDALDPAGRAELLRLALGMVRRPPAELPGPDLSGLDVGEAR